MVEPASHRGAACCWLLSRSAGRLADDGTVTDPRDMNIAAKAALKKHTSLTAADNDLSSTVTARQAHVASTTSALEAELRRLKVSQLMKRCKKELITDAAIEASASST